MIQSTSNPKVKYIRRLQNEKRFRYRERAFVVEGTRWVRDLLDRIDQRSQLLYYTESWAGKREHINILQQIGVSGQAVSEAVMKVLSDTDTPPGVLGVMRMVERPLPTSPTFILILDAITTPGNLGTMLRTAAAAGVEAVILAPGCVDAYNPKVVRGGMGAHLRLSIQNMKWDEIVQYSSGMQIWVAAAEGAQAYTAVNWKRPFALIIGSEAHGASEQARKMMSGAVAIPMHADTESLNAAMAAGIILFEAKRQKEL
ncbi:MAG: RNA methyltransferase [Chloroflexi bacterium]|nr:RNA methyltransferase [Chloroflexota bacterium]